LGLDAGPEFQPLYDAEPLKFIEAEQKLWLPLTKQYASWLRRNCWRESPTI
jgi:hypothetical protein